MKRIVIIGGGVSGLLASWVFQQVGVVPTIVEREAKLGGELMAGGLRCLRKTGRTTRMVDRIDLMSSEFALKGGMYLQEEVHRFPDCLDQMGKEAALRVMQDYWRKSRKTEPTRTDRGLMPDSKPSHPKMHFRCYLPDLVTRLSDGVDVIQDVFVKATPDKVYLENGELDWDYLVLAIPIWEYADRVWWDVVPTAAVLMNLAYVVPLHDPFSRWDMVYAPYTPGNYVHRLTPHEDGWVLESSGGLDPVRLESDAAFLFPEGYFTKWVKTGLVGHVLPFNYLTSQWPRNVVAVGRCAQGKDELQMADVLDQVWDLVPTWGLVGGDNAEAR